jgi:hypothetical protein
MKMHGKTLWVAVAAAALLLLSAGVAGALPGPWLDPDGPQAQVAGKINYQGRLTDPAGTALNGTYTLRFKLYDDPTVGTLLWDSGDLSVSVSRGLFNVALSLPTTSVDGRGLWVALSVNGELLAPRQELMPVPYALSLKPGAQIVGSPSSSSGGAVDVTMSDFQPLAAAVRGYVPSTGMAVYGNSVSGTGVYGQSHTTYGVRGSSFWGWGGYFYSQTGNGVVAESGGLDTWDHGGSFRAAMGYGVYAVSTGNAAVRAEAGATAGSLPRPGGTVGVVGLGDTRGVWGASNTGEGVYGVSRDVAGVYGETSSDSTDMGSVMGRKWSGSGVAVMGQKYGDGGVAVRGVNNGTTGSGVSGISTNYMGVWGETSRADNNYGFYTPDNLYSSNIHLAGATMQVVQNAGSATVEPGSVLVFTGVAAPPAEGAPPVVQVAAASTGQSTAVAGVAYRRFNRDALAEQDRAGGAGPKQAAEVTPDGAAAPGEYLLMVVQGPALALVDSAGGAVQPGDLLSSASAAGLAARTSRVTVQGQEVAPPGTVFGKALEAVTEGQKRIYVYVTLQ